MTTLLVSFKNLDLKDRVMANLKNLKKTVEKFKSVAQLAHDLNLQEKEAIRTWSMKQNVNMLQQNQIVWQTTVFWW